MFPIAYLSLSLPTHLCLYLAYSYCLHLYMLDAYLCLIDIHAWDCLISCMLSYCSYLHMLDIICVLTFIFNQESYWSTSTLSLEESLGEVLEPFTENSTSLFGYTLCGSVIVFNSALFGIWLAHHLFILSRCLQVVPEFGALDLGQQPWVKDPHLANHNIYFTHTYGYHDTSHVWHS